MEGKYSVSESNSQNKFWLLPNEAIFLGAAQKYKLSEFSSSRLPTPKLIFLGVAQKYK
jgi:hypothetical protein